MTELSYFANRATVKIVTGATNTNLAGDASWNSASTTVTFAAEPTGISAGDYIYNSEDDTYFQASRVTSRDGAAVTLSYNYLGTTDTDAPGYKLVLSTIAVLKGVEVTPRFEIQELYGMDSIIRQDVAKHTTKVEFKIKYAKFDPDPTADWAQYIIHPTAAPDGTIEDTNVVNVNYAIITLTSGTSNLELMLRNVYFEGLPFNLSENDFIVRDLSGVADSMSVRYY
jgi:hypothetical protein